LFSFTVVYHLPLSLAITKSYTNPTSQSPPSSPRKQFPVALKRKKLLESGFENEAGDEKERRGMGVD
jgi:hypothetical protein